MDRKQILLTKEQLREIARYENTVSNYLDGTPFDEVDIICPEAYRYTLQDLSAAMERMLETDPTVKEMGEDWLYPIRELEDVFGLAEARTEQQEPCEYPYVHISDGFYFEKAWWLLEDIWEMEPEEKHLSEIGGLREEWEVINRFLSNKGKPIPDWTFTKEEKEEYIRPFHDDDEVKNASENALALARRFTEELCADDNQEALYLKGYACYGGNRLYPCDWEASRDCMIRLYELDDNPQYMNTLGYIYYYGRANNGTPEYEKAFQCFSISAANGLYDGSYKLADMFHHGYGCARSDRTARALYGMVYADSIKQFLHGNPDANFADAAFRMGNVYADGIGEESDPEEAFAYFLQACYAAKIRLENNNFFGNQTVALSAHKRLEEVRAKLPEGFLKEEVRWNHLEIIRRYFVFAGGYQRLQLKVVPKEEGGYTFTVSRKATRAVPEPEYCLITVPEAEYCERTREITLDTTPDAELWLAGETGEVPFDYLVYNEVDFRYEFYEGETLTAWIRSAQYIFHGRKKDNSSDRLYCIVSVRFDGSQKTYDYLSEVEGLEPGDRVTVNGYNGETEVTVVSVQAKKESELGLPPEKYKKVLRKAE